MPMGSTLSGEVPAQRVAVLGATGTIGFPLARSLGVLGHEVVAISRGRTEANAGRLAQLAADGASVHYRPDLTDTAALAAALEGCDVLVVAMRASPRIVAAVEPAILEAAKAAGIARFVPSEFGTHTMAVGYGVSGQFDAKKRFLELLFASGLHWTVVYGGGIAEYFMPTLRDGDTIRTFGDTSLAWPTHLLEDIAAVSARAVTDPRTIDHAVQLYARLVTFDQLVATLRAAWPTHAFDVEHVSAEELDRMRRAANPDPGEKRLSEQEILGITYANFVLGKLGDPAFPGTLDAGDLYPDYAYRDPLELLRDRAFVFGD